MRYISTIQRQGIEQGIEQGRQEGRQEGIEQGERSLILRLLTRQFGELSKSTLERIHQLSVESLESLGEALLNFGGMNDLTQWLADHHQQNPAEVGDFQTNDDAQSDESLKMWGGLIGV